MIFLIWKRENHRSLHTYRFPVPNIIRFFKETKFFFLLLLCVDTGRSLNFGGEFSYFEVFENIMLFQEMQLYY